MVCDLLAVITLFQAVTTFKHFCSARFPSSHKEPFIDKSPGFGMFFEVYNHRAVCLRDISLAELYYLYNFGVIFSAKYLGNLSLNFVPLVKHRNTADIIHSDRVEVVS
jgi:hypothetical protein